MRYMKSYILESYILKSYILESSILESYIQKYYMPLNHIFFINPLLDDSNKLPSPLVESILNL